MGGSGLRVGVPEEPDADLPEEARRRLAARRRELEREFDLKRADLKVQHQRRLDVLEREKREWLEQRRRQAKELADRGEKARRNSDNAQRKADLGKAVRDELEQRRAQVRELERGEREAARTRKGLEAAVAAAEARLASARRRGAAAAVLLALGAAGWAVAGWRTPVGLWVLTAGMALAFLVALTAGRGKGPA